MKSKLHHNKLSLGNKIMRGLWYLVWFFLYRPTPNFMHAWRCLLLKLFGAKIGKGVHPYPTATIWAPWNLAMGDHSCLSDGVICYSVDKISIGAYSTVSQHSFLCTASHDYFHEDMPLVSAPIDIGERAWITADVFIAPGVSIGEGAVIIARSSVFQDIPPWVIARGNPAEIYKSRELSNNRTTAVSKK